MNKYLITGFSGFVSKHMLNYLNAKGSEALVMGVDVEPPRFSLAEYVHIDSDFRALNLLDLDVVRKVIHNFKPDYILHFAAFSSVGLSWLRPVESFKNKTNIFLNLIESVREISCSCRILSVGSSEEYGNVNRINLPLKE